MMICVFSLVYSIEFIAFECKPITIIVHRTRAVDYKYLIFTQTTTNNANSSIHSIVLSPDLLESAN